jgi:hypothetical protein
MYYICWILPGFSVMLDFFTSTQVAPIGSNTPSFAYPHSVSTHFTLVPLSSTLVITAMILIMPVPTHRRNHPLILASVSARIWSDTSHSWLKNFSRDVWIEKNIHLFIVCLHHLKRFWPIGEKFLTWVNYTVLWLDKTALKSVYTTSVVSNIVIE